MSSSLQTFSSRISHPFLNNGKETTLYYTYSPDETIVQFNEIFVSEYYKKGLIKKDMVVVDIGAALGFSALYFKDHAKQIYACEPCEPVFRSAVANTKDQGNILCFPLGIGGNTRKQILYGYNGAPASTIEERPNATSQEEILLVALDEFLDKNKIEHVDLLKVDCEGAEYEIFCSEGFERVASRIDYIIGEAHWQPPYYPMYIPDMLAENGFETEWLPFENLSQDLSITRPGGSVKTYKKTIKSMFFAKRIEAK